MQFQNNSIRYKKILIFRYKKKEIKTNILEKISISIPVQLDKYN